MVDPRAEEGKQVSCRHFFFFFPQKAKKCSRTTGICQKDPEANLKEHLPAKYETIPASRNNLPCFFKRNYIVQSQLIRSFSFFSFLLSRRMQANVKEKTELENHLFVIPSVTVNHQWMPKSRDKGLGDTECPPPMASFQSPCWLFIGKATLQWCSPAVATA